MSKLQSLLDEYGASHRNPTNKLIHWICIPVIIFSLFGMLWSIPLPFNDLNPWINVASVVVLLALIYYIRLSIQLTFGFIIFSGIALYGNFIIATSSNGSKLFTISLVLFVVAWIGQFIGHKLEGAKPSFFKDLQFLLIGPAWLLSFIYKKIGIAY
jgi:uncharacterized membrane protein YGL010W